MGEGHVSTFSREWWITVALVGVVIHLTASYLKPRLDQIGGWLSRSWANRNALRAKERQKRIERLKKDTEAQRDATEEEFRGLLQGIAMLLVGCVCFVTLLLTGGPKHPLFVLGIDIFWGLIGAISWLFGLSSLKEAFTIRIEVLEAGRAVIQQTIDRLDAEIKISEAEMLLIQRELDQREKTGSADTESASPE